MAHELFSLAPHAVEQATQVLDGVRQNSNVPCSESEDGSFAIPFFLGELFGLFVLPPLVRMTGRIFGGKKES